MHLREPTRSFENVSGVAAGSSATTNASSLWSARRPHIGAPEDGTKVDGRRSDTCRITEGGGSGTRRDGRWVRGGQIVMSRMGVDETNPALRQLET